MNRKKFIQVSAGLAGLGGLLTACKKSHRVAGRLLSAGAERGHFLRDKKAGPPVSVAEKEIVIIGGGVSGLAAAWQLQKSGITDFVLLELEPQPGGNAASGSNALSSFPWGAHYIPLPNNNLTEYLAFLQSCNVITGYTAEGLPHYNEQFLCFDPQERLYINGRWQDGLVPHYGVPDAELRQVEAFMKKMEEYRFCKGDDGKDAFAIPVDTSSRDKTFLQLDQQTMQAWMEQQGFTSAYLQRYINYCCRDDFGTTHDRISAWAGIHYFASRKGQGANAAHADILTWPEGNGFLVKHLGKETAGKILTNRLAVKLLAEKERVRIDYIHPDTGQVQAFRAKQCILAVPQFVAARLLQDEERVKTIKEQLQYCPWMVANFTVRKMDDRSGAPLSWDNVIHESQSLGYVEASHQLLQQDGPLRNLTYYLPLTGGSPAEARKKAQQRTGEEWVQLILDDLRIIHPDIEQATDEITVKLWGHAMVQPLPGMIFGGLRSSLSASADPRIHFAHSDLAGISIFEEAFYQGINAAKKIVKQFVAGRS